MLSFPSLFGNLRVKRGLQAIAKLGFIGELQHFTFKRAVDPGELKLTGFALDQTTDPAIFLVELHAFKRSIAIRANIFFKGSLSLFWKK